MQEDQVETRLQHSLQLMKGTYLTGSETKLPGSIYTFLCWTELLSAAGLFIVRRSTMMRRKNWPEYKAPGLQQFLFSFRNISEAVHLYQKILDPNRHRHGTSNPWDTPIRAIHTIVKGRNTVSRRFCRRQTWCIRGSIPIGRQRIGLEDEISFYPN